jgi:hypothetical protein
VESTGPDESTINKSPLTPSLEEAVEWFRQQHPRFTTAQVEAAFNSLEATKDPGGWWKFGQSRVTDWKAALLSRLVLFEQKNPAPLADSGSNEVPPSGAAKVDFNKMRV